MREGEGLSLRRLARQSLGYQAPRHHFRKKTAAEYRVESGFGRHVYHFMHLARIRQMLSIMTDFAATACLP